MKSYRIMNNIKLRFKGNIIYKHLKLDYNYNRYNCQKLFNYRIRLKYFIINKKFMRKKKLKFYKQDKMKYIEFYPLININIKS